MEPKVAIVVLNWNGLVDTRECLISLRTLDYGNFDVVVVDNGSQGSDVAELEREFCGWINMVKNAENLGYAEGNNAGIRFVTTTLNPAYILVLNNDTIADPGLLRELVGLAESDPRIGLVGPKTFSFEQPDHLQFTTARLDLRRGKVDFAAAGEQEHGQREEAAETDYVQGSCVLMRREVIEQAGLFNPNYFCYWEDAEYSLRAREAGFICAYCPSARIWHKGSASAERASGAGVYYGTRNRFWMIKRFASKPQLAIFYLYYFAVRFWLTSARYLIKHRDFREFLCLLRGIRDGLKAAPQGALASGSLENGGRFTRIRGTP